VPRFSVVYRVIEFGLPIKLPAKEAARRDSNFVIMIAKLGQANPTVVGGFLFGQPVLACDV
jgi:hypothetical protein